LREFAAALLPPDSDDPQQQVPVQDIVNETLAGLSAGQITGEDFQLILATLHQGGVSRDELTSLFGGVKVAPCAKSVVVPNFDDEEPNADQSPPPGTVLAEATVSIPNDQSDSGPPTLISEDPTVIPSSADSSMAVPSMIDPSMSDLSDPQDSDSGSDQPTPILIEASFDGPDDSDSDPSDQSMGLPIMPIAEDTLTGQTITGEGMPSDGSLYANGMDNINPTTAGQNSPIINGGPMMGPQDTTSDSQFASALSQAMSAQSTPMNGAATGDSGPGSDSGSDADSSPMVIALSPEEIQSLSSGGPDPSGVDMTDSTPDGTDDSALVYAEDASNPNYDPNANETLYAN